jgi:hypothetical protein
MTIITFDRSYFPSFFPTWWVVRIFNVYFFITDSIYRCIYHIRTIFSVFYIEISNQRTTFQVPYRDCLDCSFSHWILGSFLVWNDSSKRWRKWIDHVLNSLGTHSLTLRTYTIPRTTREKSLGIEKRLISFQDKTMMFGGMILSWGLFYTVSRNSDRVVCSFDLISTYWLTLYLNLSHMSHP